MSLNSESKKTSKRFWELDFVRGVAITIMVIFHSVYQQCYIFHTVDIGPHFFYYFSRLAAIFFLLLGISLYLGMKNEFYKSFADVVKRSFKILGLGLAITIATVIAQQGQYIFFGILHCLGVSTLLAYFFLNMNCWGLLSLGLALTSIIFFLPISHNVYLYPFVPTKIEIITFDYFPLIPFFGYVLLGIFLGKIFYKDGKRQFSISKPKFLTGIINFFSYIGSKTLIIYITHIPILFLVTNFIIYFIAPEHFIDIISLIKIFFNF